MKDLEICLKALLFMCHEPAIGIKDKKVCFANPAATSLLSAELEGADAIGLIPEHILTETASCFLCSAVIGGYAGTVCATRIEKLLFISFTPNRRNGKTEPIVPTAVMNSLRSMVFNMKIAADNIVSRIDLKSDPKLEKYTSLLYHNYFTTLRLIGNLYTASALIDGSIDFSPVIVDMVVICNEMIDSVSHLIADKGIELNFEFSESSLPAVVDREKVEQLILNLLSNSIAHTESSGQITLSLKNLNDKIIISVDDTGDGIPPEVLSSVFSRFAKNSDLNELSSGGGLGLGIAKGIAELHGGALVIESNKRKGTSVRVMLPTDTPPSARFHDAHTEYHQAGMSNILIELSGVLNYEYYSGKYFD